MNVEQTRTALIASMNDTIKSLQAARDALTDDERVLYIVTCSDLPINVHGKPGLGGMVTTVADASRFFELATAQAFAKRVINGEGERGRVVTLGSAFNDAINRAQDCIHSLQARGPQSE